MIATKSITLLFVVSAWLTTALAQKDCEDAWVGSHMNRTVEFSLLSKKNQTGHWITKFSLDNAAQRLPKNWKADIKHSVTRDGGLEVFRLQGRLVVPPALPADYQLFPGVGYYKFHKEVPLTFDDAYTECAKEGGHLAIINSEAEHNVIHSLVKKDSAYLGFHDRVKEGEFMTIFGQPLSSTGFAKWTPNQPDNAGGKEHCGSYYAGNALNDIPCDLKVPFICEYDLSWAE